MIELDCLLNKDHNEIRHAILYVGSGYPAWRLKELLDHTNLDMLILTGSISDKTAGKMIEELKLQASFGKQKLPKQFSFCPLDKLTRPDGEFALLCEALGESRDILSLTSLQPDYLVGQIPEDGISSFGIWEAFRGCCKRIHLTTIRQQWDDRQVLDWTKDPKNDIELSVIFPMYNVAKYLNQCIQSVTAWKADYVEFLFVNDGSPDNSRDIVLHWAEKDPRIKLLDKPNGGCASARQWGLDRAKGRYVGFVDPDDFVDESMFRKLLRGAMIGSYDICYCGYKEYYDNTGDTKEVIDVLGFPYDKGVSDVRRIQELIAYARVAIWRGIYKMDMLRQNNIHFYTELRRFDDLPFKVETFAVARSVITINEPLYYYRLARPGQDVSADDERLYVHFPIFEHLNASVASKKDSRVIDWLQLCKIQTHRFALERIKPEFMKEYIRQARADLATTGSLWRTLSIAKKMVGKRSTLFYWGIMRKDYTLIRRLCGKKDRKKG